MFCPNLIVAYLCQLLFIFLNRESNENVHNGKVCNVNNEFIVTNV